MAVINRKAMREEFGALLSAALVASAIDIDAGDVYDYIPADLDGQSPVVGLAAGGSDRSIKTLNPKADNQMILGVVVFVRAADKDTLADGYTAETVADLLDDIEAVVAQTVVDNKRGTNWRRLRYDGSSQIDSITTLSGTPYVMESIPLVVYALDT